MKMMAGLQSIAPLKILVTNLRHDISQRHKVADRDAYFSDFAWYSLSTSLFLTLK